MRGVKDKFKEWLGFVFYLVLVLGLLEVVSEYRDF